jgi:sugar lactone lactonase YvrE
MNWLASRKARLMRAISWLFRVIVLTSLLVVGSGSVAAAPPAEQGDPFPSLIRLPDGFRPEGIAVGRGHTFYVGSIPTGAVYRGDLRTGEGAVLVPAQAGRMAIGLKVDHRNRLFVAGGPTGHAYVYDAGTGATLATYQLTTGNTFVNDVIITGTGAWFTDSFNGRLYHVPIAPNGTLGSQADVQTLPLSGDIVITPGAFNVNGIAATPNGQTLIIVQSNTGKPFTVDPATGVTHEIALTGGTVVNGDGILLHGKTLYVVQNTLNQVAVVNLTADLSAGTITGHLTDPDLDVPTTLARLGDRLYTVNACFSTPPTPTTRYDVVQL